MTLYEDLVASTAWDARYSLPTVPRHNNPWIYTAYALLCLNRAQSTQDYRLTLMFPLQEYYSACLREPGLIFRWPDHSGGDTSNDEVMGAAWLLPFAAHQISQYLYEMTGKYTVMYGTSWYSSNLYRFFPWLIPFLRGCEGKKVSVLAQVSWGICAVLDTVNWTPDKGGGTLKMWLQSDIMRNFPVSAWFYRIWKRRLEGRYGTSPQKIFQTSYLVEEPIFAAIAPTEF